MLPLVRLMSAVGEGNSAHLVDGESDQCRCKLDSAVYPTR